MQLEDLAGNEYKLVPLCQKLNHATTPHQAVTKLV